MAETFTLSNGVIMALPVQYQDFTMVSAAFTAPARRVQDLLPTRRLRPLLLLPGRAIVQVTVFQYHRISGVQPYNELAVTVPVQYDPIVNLPGLPAVAHPVLRPGWYRKVGLFVRHLPVTTDEAMRFGVEIWGYPKTVMEIACDDGPVRRRCTLRSGESEVLAMDVRRSRTTHRQVAFHTYTVKGGRLLRTLVQTEGQYSIGRLPGGASLSLGTGPIAEELRSLGMARHAVNRIYGTGIRSLLHGAGEELSL